MLKTVNMDLKDAFERFDESLKKAASRCRELGAMLKDRNWQNVAIQIDTLRDTGGKIYTSKAVTRQELLKAINLYNSKEAAKLQ